MSNLVSNLELARLAWYIFRPVFVAVADATDNKFDDAIVKVADQFFSNLSGVSMPAPAPDMPIPNPTPGPNPGVANMPIPNSE